jgi:hypothetical protein
VIADTRREKCMRFTQLLLFNLGNLLFPMPSLGLRGVPAMRHKT